MKPSSYVAAHRHVAATRGPARDHSCFQCGAPALHWAYQHDDPDERLELRGGFWVPFSSDPKHYEPMCVACHRRFDARPLTHCRSGRHDLVETAIERGDGGRQCGACKAERERSAEHRERQNAQRDAARRAAGIPLGPGRKTHCPQGHSYSGENLRIHKNGTRRCAECNRARLRALRAQRKGDPS